MNIKKILFILTCLLPYMADIEAFDLFGSPSDLSSVVSRHQVLGGYSDQGSDSEESDGISDSDDKSYYTTDADTTFESEFDTTLESSGTDSDDEPQASEENHSSLFASPADISFGSIEDSNDSEDEGGFRTPRKSSDTSLLQNGSPAFSPLTFASPYTKVSEQLGPICSVTIPFSWDEAREGKALSLLLGFIKNNLSAKDENFTRIYKELCVYMPKFSSDGKSSILLFLSEKVKNLVVDTTTAANSGTIARLIGIIWGYNAQLPESKKLDLKELPLPAFENIKHIINPTILPGSGKAVGYHFINKSFQAKKKYSVMSIFSSSLGVYAGVWGSKDFSKCSTFFPDIWAGAADIQDTVNQVLKNPLAIALTKKSLPKEKPLIIDEELRDDCDVVQTMRFLGRGKDSVLTEVILNNETGFIITAYPILEYHDLTIENISAGNITIGSGDYKKTYTRDQINNVVAQARTNDNNVRYSESNYDVVDIAQIVCADLLFKQELPADFRGIYIKAAKQEPIDEFTTSTSSS